MIVDVILLQDSSSIVIEVDAYLLATVDPVSPQDGLTASSDPHTSQGIRVDLVTLDDATPIIMLKKGTRCG